MIRYVHRGVTADITSRRTFCHGPSLHCRLSESISADWDAPMSTSESDSRRWLSRLDLGERFVDFPSTCPGYRPAHGGHDVTAEADIMSRRALWHGLSLHRSARAIDRLARYREHGVPVGTRPSGSIGNAGRDARTACACCRPAVGRAAANLPQASLRLGALSRAAPGGRIRVNGALPASVGARLGLNPAHSDRAGGWF